MIRLTVSRVATLAAVAIGLAFTSPAAAQLGRQQGLIDPNIASEQQLAGLPNMNATLAKGIVEKRPFLSIVDLNTYLSQSLSAEQLRELYGKMFIHVNLNLSPAAEIMLIPGAGRRMAREFDEYKPYKAYAQFRREIGKYVDEKEVARLEQYTFIPVELNTASDEDILSIPGVGQRMLGEFKEYRPYPNIEKFRREIGKYVNAKELARLERYVTIAAK